MSFLSLGISFLGVDILLMSLLLYTKALCKHLTWMIKNVETGNWMINQNHIKQSLINCIIAHNKIQKYCADVNEITSFIIFVQHLNALLGSCTIIFQASLVKLNNCLFFNPIQIF